MPRCSTIKNQGRCANIRDALIIVVTWVTGDQGQLEDTDIDHEICKNMARFMTDSSSYKSPGHHEKTSNIQPGRN